MFDDPCSEDDHNYCSGLLAKLERPLSFIGEKRNRFIFFRGKWVDVDVLLEEVKDDPRKRSNMMQDLMERLNEIKSELSSTCMTREEAIDLFEEGVAIKRAVHLLNTGSVNRDEGSHGDIRRWLAYGKRIT